jgi:ABC-type oligopeptide transport system ATPase subunit
MSIIVRDKTAASKSLDIPIGYTKTKTIYVNLNIPKEKRIKEATTPNEVIKPIPYLDLEHNQRSASFISGISGSGKSTLAAHLIKELRKIHGYTPQIETQYVEIAVPHQVISVLKYGKRYREVQVEVMKPKKIIVFTSSTLSEPDPAFEKLDNMSLIPFDNPTFLDITLEHLANKIIVFDDWESIKSKELSRHVEHLIRDLLERSRKLKTDIIIINHMTQNYTRTKPIIFECDTYYLNPSMNRNSTKKFLKEYMDLDEKSLKKIIEYEPSNAFTWLVARKSAPQYLLYDDMVNLL